jgi:hypothetical protein
MSCPDPAELKLLYEERLNHLLRDGVLGFGIHEELLRSSAASFDRTLLSGGGALADFFATALQEHVALLLAVNLTENEDAADLHAFLSEVVACLSSLPKPILQKSPQPLGLVIGNHGGGFRLGAQWLQKGAPAIIFWRTFQSLRKSLHTESYAQLRDLLRKTIIHEVIGHQLAFCTSAGPLVTREELRQILQLGGITRLDLTDGSHVSAAQFVESPDLLEMMRRIRYLVSPYSPDRYYENPAEMIAFAVEGEWPAHRAYRSILNVLKQHFLLDPSPLHTAEASDHVLFQGFDVSTSPATRYFLERAGEGVRETEALQTPAGWISRERLLDRFYQHHKPDGPGNQVVLEPARAAAIHLPAPGLQIELGDGWYLVCAFGVFGHQAARIAQPLPFTSGNVRVALHHDSSGDRLILTSTAAESVVAIIRY